MLGVMHTREIRVLHLAEISEAGRDIVGSNNRATVTAGNIVEDDATIVAAITRNLAPARFDRHQKRPRLEGQSHRARPPPRTQ